MVPNGWEFTTFENHIDLLSGFAFKSAQYTENSDDIRLLRGDNIAPNTLRWDGVKTWDKHQYSKLQKYHLRENDFVIAMDRTWVSSGLKVAEVTKNDLPCLLVQRVARIRALPTLEQSLLRQYFSSHRFEQYVKGVQTETAVPHISSKQIKEFPLLLPPLPEQRKIAKILSTWDKAITTTERLIDASQQQKKALMQQLLTGKKRLLNPETGKVFEGEWRHYSFGEIAKIKTKKYDPRTEVVSLPCIELEHLSQDTGRILGAANSLELASIKNRFQRGDVLFGKLRPYLRKFARPDFDGVCSTEIWVLKVTSKIMYEYLYQFIQTNIFVSEANKSAGSKMPRADWGVVSELVLKLPSLSEQQKIASVLTAADKEIELLEAKLAHLREEKKALMQQLLTGKRRVKVETMEEATC
jgi:type I restriction enzyme S subunit